MAFFTTTKTKLVEAQQSIADFQSKQTALQAQVDQLTKQLADKDTELNSIKQANVSLTQFQELQTQFDEYKKNSVEMAKFTELETKFNVTVQELEKVKTEQQTAKQLAATIVAQTGTPPVSVKPEQGVEVNPHVTMNEDGSYTPKGGRSKIYSMNKPQPNATTNVPTPAQIAKA